MDRIIQMVPEGEKLVVETTTEKLAQHLGRAIYKAYKGDLSFQWGEPNVRAGLLGQVSRRGNPLGRPCLVDGLSSLCRMSLRRGAARLLLGRWPTSASPRIKGEPSPRTSIPEAVNRGGRPVDIIGVRT